MSMPTKETPMYTYTIQIAITSPASSRAQFIGISSCSV